MTFHNIPESDDGLAPPLQSRPADEAIGGYTQVEELRATIWEEAGYLPPAQAGSPDAFMSAAIDYIKSRLAADSEGPLSGIVVFTQVEYPRKLGERLGLERIRGFKFSHATLGGRVFVTSGSLNDAHVADAECTELAKAFSILAELGLPERPTVIINLGSGELVWCPYGVEDEESAVRMSILSDANSSGDSTYDAITDSIDRFHRSWSQIPEVHAGIWADEQSFVPAPDVEQKFQNLLFPVLLTRFRSTHIVRREDTIIPGRTDLSLTPLPRHGRDGVSVVGISALRSMNPAERLDRSPRPVHVAENEREIEDGLASGAHYRRVVIGCRNVLLCVFDMQREDDGGSLMRAFEAYAQEHQIELRRFLVPNLGRAITRQESRGSQN